jgi:DNA polymerase/3'-5' exonuclease PolX
MELNKAKEIAAGIVAQLAPYCERIEIAGSIRRGRPEVHDIDIVCIPSGPAFYRALQGVGQPCDNGSKIHRIALPGQVSQGKQFCADIYIATEATWATLLLIRTGSADHNKHLCTLARQKGMRLHADGEGLELVAKDPRDLFNQGPPVVQGAIPCRTETDIFNALGLKFKAPGERT